MKNGTPLPRLYDSVRWRKARLAFLAANPLCVLCAREGKDTPATVIDHKKPHGGDYNLFWSRDNWQGLCATCHGEKRRQEKGGLLPGADLDGFPLDPNHPWGRKEN